jgi:glucoside 3-dehydrogenase (cytochrome c) hitch-hiker subunit
MHRRNVLQTLGSAIGVSALAGATPQHLFALGREIHDRTAARPRVRALVVLDEHQDRTVTTIAEHIIPATDTPGARAAMVNEFIDLLLAEWTEQEEREHFLRGLADVDTRCLNLFGKVFVETGEAQQIAILSGLDAEVTALRDGGGDAGNHFFSQMKWLTLYGYYTSEIGQTEEVQAMIIPGRYDPCGPVHRDASGAW